MWLVTAITKDGLFGIDSKRGAGRFRGEASTTIGENNALKDAIIEIKIHISRVRLGCLLNKVAHAYTSVEVEGEEVRKFGLRIMSYRFLYLAWNNLVSIRYQHHFMALYCMGNYNFGTSNISSQGLAEIQHRGARRWDQWGVWSLPYDGKYGGGCAWSSSRGIRWIKWKWKQFYAARSGGSVAGAQGGGSVWPQLCGDWFYCWG